MRAYPELKRMMSQREREKNYVRSRRTLEKSKGESILEFWSELAERIHNEEELDNMERVLTEIRSDIDMLKSLKMTCEMSKGDPDKMAELQAIMRLLQLLLDIYEKFKKRHWFLRDRALAYWMSLNRAMPSKLQDQIDKDKDKTGKLKGQDKAKKANEQTRKVKKAPTKKKEA